MSPSEVPDRPRPAAPDDVLADYLARLDRGEAVDRERFLAEHPEAADQLRSYFAACDELAQMAAPPGAFTPRPEATVAEPPAAGGPEPFGDYELLEEIARGGMGVVYKARQKSLNRLVALKMILGEADSAAGVQRFRAEAVAQLDHPHIVPVYEVGEHAGQPYFTMKLIDGGTLAGPAGEPAHDPRAAAVLLATVARAVHFAHQHGILHRDLKPSNVLLDRDGRPTSPTSGWLAASRSRAA